MLGGFDEFVLVDDVFTTGSTLDACAYALLKAGYQNVKVATMGRVNFYKHGIFSKPKYSNVNVKSRGVAKCLD